jgi:rhodanese-related sulfurtransferase
MLNFSPQIPEVDSEALHGMLHSGQAVLIDVREPEEFARERITGAKPVPLSAFNIGEFPHDQEVVVMCRSGHRSGHVTMHLRQLGYEKIYNLQGGIIAWRQAGFPTVVDASQPLPKSA